jgi:hypothetical protein
MLVALLVLVVTGGSRAGRISLNGYFKNYSVMYHFPNVVAGTTVLDSLLGPYSDNPPLGWVNNRLRLNLGWRLWSRVSLDASYDIAARVQDPALTAGDLLWDQGLNQLPYRVDDFDQRLYPGMDETATSFGLYHNLDRLYLSLRAPWFDFYAGRQAIAWGAARTVNPTDIIAPFAYSQLDIEDRLGVDAVRARVPLGFMAEMDAGVVMGDDADHDNNTYFLRSKFYLTGNDVSLVAAAFRGNTMIGGDWARSIGGAGFWLEAAWAHTSVYGEDSLDGDDYLRLSTGLDYQLTPLLYGFVEYHYNGPGYTDADDYVSATERPAYREGGVYLLGEHYLIPGAVYQLTPLITLSGETLLNVTDPSAYIVANAEYNIAENIYLSGGFYVSAGQSPLLNEAPEGPSEAVDFKSELGAYPDIIYTSFRVYF